MLARQRHEGRLPLKMQSEKQKSVEAERRPDDQGLVQTEFGPLPGMSGGQGGETVENGEAGRWRNTKAILAEVGIVVFQGISRKASVPWTCVKTE